MRACLTLVVLLSWSGMAAGIDVTFPLDVDHGILGAVLARHLADERGVWSDDACRTVHVRGVKVDAADTRLRLSAHVDARLGFRILGFCFAPLSWRGLIETTAAPRVDAAWQLRLADPSSRLLDDAGNPARVADRLWRLLAQRFESEVSSFAVDLAPPADEVRSLLSASVPAPEARAALSALASLRPRSVAVTPDATVIHAEFTLPDAVAGPTPAEPPLAPYEVERWRALLEQWDGFLIFVVKDLGPLAPDDPVARDALLTLLLESRFTLLDVLAHGPSSAPDPVRLLFVRAWDGLRAAARRAAARGELGDRALRYATFVAAGDALAALDAAAPSLGMEISADGLRRLARVLAPEHPGDPLADDEGEDPVLRELFGFHLPMSAADVGLPDQPPRSWLGPRAAWARDGDALLAHSARRLDRWVPDRHELDEYRDHVERVLRAVGTRTAELNRVDVRFGRLYQDLLRATAWQESCWRQFVRVDGVVRYLESSTGDVGIMQVNRRVWRGFFDVEKLQWDLVYNAGAGAEILAQLLVRYGVREADRRLDDAARAAYSAYNGGPAAYRRYRQTRVARRLRNIDRAFWEKYQAIAAGEGFDYVLCVERWPARGSRARLSTGSPTSRRWCSTSMRRSSATRTMPSRQATRPSRPRASRV